MIGPQQNTSSSCRSFRSLAPAPMANVSVSIREPCRVGFDPTTASSHWALTNVPFAALAVRHRVPPSPCQLQRHLVCSSPTDSRLAASMSRCESLKTCNGRSPISNCLFQSGRATCTERVRPHLDLSLCGFESRFAHTPGFSGQEEVRTGPRSSCLRYHAHVNARGFPVIQKSAPRQRSRGQLGADTLFTWSK